LSVRHRSLCKAHSAHIPHLDSGCGGRAVRSGRPQQKGFRGGGLCANRRYNCQAG
jgi:hypothetical protein